MAQIRCKDLWHKPQAGVGSNISQLGGSISNLYCLYLQGNPVFRHRLSTSVRLLFYETEKEKKKGKEN
jgi:hypothetical protein